MGSKYPESGMSAVLDLSDFTPNAKVYLTLSEKMDKADTNSEKASEKAARGRKKYADALGDAAKSVKDGLSNLGKLADKTEESGKSAERASQGFSKFTERLIQVDAGINILNTAFDAVSRVSDAVQDLVGRANQIETVSSAFSNTAGALGSQEEVLSRWRDQSQGVVTDLELMRQGNVALINLSRESQQVIGEGFGTVVAAAFAGAAATGQDLNLILDKSIKGIRRRSNALLDDIGVWVEADVANQRYAETLGITVEQMTEAQKAAAWQAEAIRQMTSIIEQAGTVQVSASQQAATAWENAVNQIAVSMQAGTTAMDQGLADASMGISAFVSQSAPYMGIIAEVAGQAFASVGANARSSLSGLDPAPFFTGGVNLISALAQGILTGATYVIQAVNVIAGIVRDFLMGFSPPKLGPLSTIDEGGQNVVDAWISAFDKVSLDPAVDLAGNVNDILMGIGNLETGDQITVLEQLQNRLQDRLNASIEALTQGADNAEEVRALDEQRVALRDQIEMLKERNALEQAGLIISDSYASSIGDGVDASVQLKKLEEQIAGQQNYAAAGGTAQKDKLQELYEQLQANEKLQGEYTTGGLETNDLLRDELRLREQIAAEESARNLDNMGQLGEIADLQAQLDAQRSTGGGAGGGLAPIDLGDEDPYAAVVGGAAGGAAPMDPFSRSEALFNESMDQTGTFRSQITGAFDGIAGAYETFTTELSNLQATFSEIDLFAPFRPIIDAFESGDQQQIFDALSTFVVDLGTNLLSLPSHAISEIIGFFEALTGVEVSDSVRTGLQIVGTVGALGAVASVAGPALAGLAASAGSALIAFGPMAVAVGGIVLGIEILNQKFGSFEEGLRQAGTAAEDIRLLIEIAFESIRNAIQTAIDNVIYGILTFINDIDQAATDAGIDLGIDVTANLNEIEMRRQRQAVQEQLQAEIAQIVSGDRVEISPSLAVAFEEGNIEVPHRARVILERRIRDQAGFDEVDPIDLAAQIRVADFLNVEVDPAARARLGEEQLRIAETYDTWIAEQPLDITEVVRLANDITFLDENTGDVPPELRQELAEKAAQLEAWAEENPTQVSVLVDALPVLEEAGVELDPAFVESLQNTARSQAARVTPVSVSVPVNPEPVSDAAAAATTDGATWTVRGYEAAQLFLDGIESVQPDAALAGEELGASAVSGLTGSDGEGAATSGGTTLARWNKGGQDAGTAYIDGLESTVAAAGEAGRQISEAVARNIVGQSPPPEGPLSTVDLGGEAIIAAWLSAFDNADLTPVESFAARVMAIVGGMPGETGMMDGLATDGGLLADAETQFGSELDATISTWASTATASISGVETTLAQLVEMAAGEYIPIWSESLSLADQYVISLTGSMDLANASGILLTTTTQLMDLAILQVNTDFGSLTRSIDASTVAVGRFAEALAMVPEGLAHLSVSFDWRVPGLEQRAGGGAINANQPYLVGENGPEVFMSSQAGSIFNDEQLVEMMFPHLTSVAQPPVVNVTVLPAPVVVQPSGGDTYNTTVNTRQYSGTDLQHEFTAMRGRQVR